jgi:hypothetical protein
MNDLKAQNQLLPVKFLLLLLLLLLLLERRKRRCGRGRKIL